jgi:hypothetical protein
MHELTAAEIAAHVADLERQRVTLIKRLRRIYRSAQQATDEYRLLEDRAAKAKALLRWKQLESGV